MHVPCSCPNGTRLYAFGSNGAGQLGLGHYEDTSEPQACQFDPSSLNDSHTDDSSSAKVYAISDIKNIVAGGNHTLLLTGNGDVYASGNNEDGRCAIPTDKTSLCAFTRVSWAQSRTITHLAATWETSYLVQDAHIVWASGSGAKGELGLGQDMLLSSKPCLVLDVWELGEQTCEIVSIAGGMNHVVVLLSNGHVYGWGSCRKGQLGDLQKQNKVMWRPQRLQLPASIIHITAGRDFTVLVGADQALRVWGDLKSNGRNIETLSADRSPEYRSGWSTLYALENGHVQGCGLGQRGQLPPSNLPPLAQLAAGSEHCVALTDKGEVITWGWGEHGNCGEPLDNRNCVAERFNSISIPHSEAVHVIGVAAGCASSFVWTVN